MNFALRAIFIAPLLCALAACQPRLQQTAAQPDTSAPVTVQTSTVEARSVPQFLEVTGELKGGRVSSVAADGAGKVRETRVERGTTVKAGDVLVKLDNRAAVLALRESEATLAQAQSRLKLARADWERNQHLAKSKLIAPAEAQKFEAEARSGEADVAAAEARRDSAKKALEDTEVRAPFAGTIVERLVNAGEYLQPGARVAVMIAEEDLRLWLNVPEVASGSVHQGQAVTFRVPAFPGNEFKGKVRYISPIVREAGRDLLVEAEVQAGDHRLLQGMFAQVRLALPEKRGLVVPSSAIRKDGGVHKVLVPEGAHLAERIVEVGVAQDAWVEIRAGLIAGDAVVVQPARDARDGARFTIAAR